MPHTKIEYSANIARHHDIDALVEVVHDVMIRLDLAQLGAYRTRAEKREIYRVADGDPDSGFVAIVVRIGPGRSAGIKRGIMSVLLDAAEAQFASESSVMAVAWSIEVQEIDADFRENRNRVVERMAGRTVTEQGGR